MGARYHIKLAIFFALLQNSTWPLQTIFYAHQRRQETIKREVTWDMMKSYVFLGSLSTFITLSRTIGLTTLPPTIYVICANTEIVFETIMTKAILKKNVNMLQIFSVALVISGVAASLYNPISKRYGHNENVDRSHLIIGVALSLASRLASSLNTISAEKFLGTDAKSYFGVLEVAIVNSLIPSLLLPIVLALGAETKQWGCLLQVGTFDTACVALLCVGIALSKYADRLCKFGIVHAASTLFFAVIDANMKVVAGLGSIFFFHEKVYWPQFLGFALIVLSMVLSVLNKHLSAGSKLSISTASFELSSQPENDCQISAPWHRMCTEDHMPQSLGSLSGAGRSGGGGGAGKYLVVCSDLVDSSESGGDTHHEEGADEEDDHLAY